MLAIDMEPLRKGEHEGFRAFVQGLDAKYRIPDTATVKNRLLPDQFQYLLKRLSEALSSCEYMAITTDMWTSNSNEGILAVTGHLIKDGKLIAPLLEVTKLEGSHTAIHIASAIETILMKWNVREKVVAMVSDNAQTMINVAQNLKLRHVPCFAHTLNLVVSDCFKLPEFDEILSKCKKIATFFRSSTLASDKLRKIQRESNKMELKLIQEVSTRWNSAYYMMTRIVNIQSEITLAFNECENAPAALTAEEYKILQEIINLLEPFELATQKISGEEYVTISLIIPLIRGISFSLSQLETNLTSLTALNILEQLKQSIAKRLKPYEQRTPTILATILDPRFKRKGFKTEEESQRAAQTLQREYSAHLNEWKATRALLTTDDTPAQPASPQPSTSKFKSLHATKSKQNKKMDHLFNFLEKPHPTSVSSTTDAIIDTRQFLEKPIIYMSQCPIQFWDQFNSSKLKQVANKYLCIPATSVPSERIFSKAGQIQVERRNRLKDKTLNMLLFIKQNVNFLE